MKTITTFVKNNSFVVFVVLAYLLSWWPALLDFGLIPQGPLLAALLVAGLSQGKVGAKDWWSQVVRRSGDWRWYAVAAAIPLVITFTAAGLNILLGAQLPTQIEWSTPFRVLPILLLLGGQWEEPGWTGFGLPHLYQRFGPSAAGTLTATLIMAVVRTAWHLPLMLSGSIYWSDIVTGIAFQIVLTWLFNRSGGIVLAVILCHLLNNMIYAFVSPWFIGAHWVQLAWLFAGTWSLLALGLLFFVGPHLGRNPEMPAKTLLVGQPVAQK